MPIRQIQKAQSSTKYPAITLVKKDPKLAAMISKAVTSNTYTPARNESGNRKTEIPHTYAFKSILNKRAKRNSDAATILKLLPDIELSIQILISSIQSPSDMMSTELIFSGPKNLTTSELMGSLLNRTKEYFDETYKIKPLIPKMLRDILAEKGSYPVAVIPENSIDAFINGDQAVTMESFKDYVDKDGKPKNIGVLGNYTTETARASKVGLAFESFKEKVDITQINNKLHYKEVDKTGAIKYVTEDYLFVTDNPSTLKFSKVNKLMKAKVIKETFNKGNVSLEAIDKTMSDLQVERLVYRTRSFKADPVATLKKQHELARTSVGNPLIMKLPSESVIPVHVPGNVEQHIGYFVILDEEGNPIEAADGDQYYNGIGVGVGGASNNTISSNIIQKVETNMGGGSSFDPSNAGHQAFATRIYSDMVEQDLIARIKNGVHSSSVALAKNEEVYRIMLSRVLAKKYTQILFLPIEYVTYFAFKYTDDGIGRSLLDETSMINTLRTVMLFTDVISSIKNSIGRTQVTMTLPENDPNPLKTIEQAQDEIVRSRQLGIPLGVTNPSDITDFIQRAGFEWKFEGHKGLPDLKFDFQNTNSSFTKPDSDLQDFLRKSSIQGMGLPPELVDSGFNSEFATTVVANNILLGKRVLQYQEIYNPLLSDHLRKVASNSENLMNDLRDIIRENKESIRIELDDDLDEYVKTLQEEVKQTLLINKVLSDFINLFEVTLPKPVSSTLTNQIDDLKVYTSGLDEAIDAYISDSFMTTSTSGDLSNEINTIKAAIKSHFTRAKMVEMGLFTELSDLVATREDGEPQMNLMNEITNHIAALTRSGVTAIVKLQPLVAAANKDLTASGADPSDDTGGSDTSDSSDSGGEFGGDSEDDFGLGALDETDDTITDDTSTTDDVEGDNTKTDKVDNTDDTVVNPEA